MNRETKIGMLTGLGVIVLIGVLLSQYFEQNNLGNRPAPMSDVTAHYRQATQSPVGVPTLDTDSALASAQGISLRLPDQNSLPAFAAQNSGNNPANPANNTPASANPAPAQLPEVIPAAPAQPTMPPLAPSVANAPASNDPQPVQPAVYNANNPTSAIPQPNGPTPISFEKPTPTPTSAAAKPTGTQYVIAKGDTLTIISKKFYHSATKADRQLIMSANNMKDEKSLIAGKKLLIPANPNQPLAQSPATPAPTKTPVAASSTIKLPGSSTPAAATPAQPTHIEAPKSTTTYTVKSNDTLEKIAAKFLGSHSKQAQQQILTLNHLKSADLQIGQILKIPAKTTTPKSTPPTPKG